MMNLSGKRILITGASRGIGCALARELARQGSSLALVARSEAPLRALAAELGATAYPADLAAAESFAGLIDRIESDGPVDVLINNAGISHVKYFLDNTPEEIEQVFRTNILAPVHLCRQLIPRMLARGGGHVVNISSLAAVMTPPGLVHYAATKAALSHYTAALRQDLRGLPIGTTLVELGSVRTELDDMSRRYGPLRKLVQQSQGRDITPMPVVVDAIARAVKENRRHVRLPKQAAPLCMLAEAPRRLTEWMFRKVEPRE